MIFGGIYAEAYDGIYADKDYRAECDILESLFRKHGGGLQIRSVLDMGCGGGGHSLELANRGFEVLGIDASPDMVSVAESKRPVGLTNPGFRAADLRDFRAGRRFGAAIMMFGPFSHQVTNRDAMAALRTARAHLDPGGLVVFDFWHGPGVLFDRPRNMWKESDGPRGKYLRAASADVDVRRQTVTVRISLWGLSGGAFLQGVRETHTMRFFFPMEVELMIESAGFELAEMGGWPDMAKEPDLHTWTACAVGRAV